MDRPDGNVISLEKFKQIKKSRQQEESFALYLEKLQSADLVNEARTCIDDIQNPKASYDCFKRAEKVLQELSARILTQNEVGLKALSDLREKIEKKIAKVYPCDQF